jgi:V/A-type H+-transporting ATPase subunit E
MHFVLSSGGGMLREGVSFGSTDQIENGIRVKLTGDDMHVELTANAVGEYLLAHMLPRFRALLRGAVVLDGAPPQPQAVRRAAG